MHNQIGFSQLIRSARDLRALIGQDLHRPRYHFMPPEGLFNDANGALYWHGRYHLFYLTRAPIPQPEDASKDTWVAVWDHASSHDLVHWIYHPTAITAAPDGSMPKGIYSGGAIKNAPQPTLIYHVPGQGTCISVARDNELINWEPLPDNPVIPMHTADDEFVVFDPCAWYEDGVYYALVGNKNHRPGFEGDCTSLFRSTDLVQWAYQGPFYQSSREWTDDIEDAACPDFYPLGDKHMLLMHGHRPYGQCHYYLGRYENEQFYPEQHGRMNWPGGQLSGPESLIDENGRNIFFGWVREARPVSFWEPDRAWASVMSLPRLMTLRDNDMLGIEPVPELETLRINPRHLTDIEIPANDEVMLETISGDCMELYLEMDLGEASEVGVKVRCSPDSEESTEISIMPQEAIFQIHLDKSTLDPSVDYGGATSQVAPFSLAAGETLKLRIFLDRSILEVFANDRQCLTQRIYPTRKDSTGVRLFARGGRAGAEIVDAWDMAPVAIW